jgi:hypothetical protein
MVALAALLLRLPGVGNAVQRARLLWWIVRGRPLPPPPLVKQRTLLDYGQRYGLLTLIETGTYRGDSIWALRGSFSEIHSVEIDRALYEKAQQRFNGLEHVHLHVGDSGWVLSDLLSRIDGPALLFLDGHYSGGVTARGPLDTPIIAELDAALAPTGFDHVILIDDARCFRGEKGYPTLDEIRKATLARKPHLSITVSNDMIRICPPKT